MTSTHESRTITNSTSHTTVTAGRSARRLLGLTSALLALQVLNLAVFDDLRTDESVGVLETFTKPQHLSSIVAVLLAVILVARRHRHAARVAVVVAWIEIAAFTFFHGIPVQIGPAKPYWGDGSGDASAVARLPLDHGVQHRHRRRRPKALVNDGCNRAGRQDPDIVDASDIESIATTTTRPSARSRATRPAGGLSIWASPIGRRALRTEAQRVSGPAGTPRL